MKIPHAPVILMLLPVGTVVGRNHPYFMQLGAGPQFCDGDIGVPFSKWGKHIHAGLLFNRKNCLNGPDNIRHPEFLLDIPQGSG